MTSFRPTSAPSFWSACFRSTPRRRRPSRRLQLENLEDRTVPATVFLHPTTFADGPAGSGSLRDMILKANSDGQDDVIILDAGTYTLSVQNSTVPGPGGLMIPLHEYGAQTGDLGLTESGHSIVIRGAGEGQTTIDGSGLFVQLLGKTVGDRIFQVGSGVTAVLRGLTLTNGVTADNGTDMVPPGATPGQGGAVLVSQGANVTLDNVALVEDVAGGGPGGTPTNMTPNGLPAQGGGIFNAGNLTLSNVTFNHDRAESGAGAAATTGGDTGGTGGSALGGALYNTGTVSLTNVSFLESVATAGTGGDAQGTGSTGGTGGDDAGGDIYNSGTLTAAGVFSQGAVSFAGDGGKALGTSANGGAGGNARGGFLFNTGTVNLSDSTLTGSVLDGGFGIAGFSATAAAPAAGGNGGNSGMGQGGSIFNQGQMTLTAVTVSENYTTGLRGGAGGTGVPGGAGGNGGAGQGTVYNDALATLTVNDSAVVENSVSGGNGGAGGTGLGSGGNGGSGGTGSSSQGGAIYNLGQLTLTNSTLSGNLNSGGAGGAGGNAGTTGNGGNGGAGADSAGGGLFVAGGTVSVDNSTVANNTNLTTNFLPSNGGTGGTGSGGGTNGTSGVTGSRLGGGVRQVGGTVTAISSLFAANFSQGDPNPDYSGTVTASASLFSVFTPNAPAGTASTIQVGAFGPNLTNVDARLMPLGNYGGPTLTQALQPGSPAIDRGANPLGLAFDQRGPGFARVSGVRADIGAFELQRPLPTPPSLPEPEPVPLVALGTPTGRPPVVLVFNASTGRLRFLVRPYSRHFHGGVRVALGDVNHDGIPDLVVAPGPGLSSNLIQIYDGATGRLLREFPAFAGRDVQGLQVTTADVNHDGFADILVSRRVHHHTETAVFSGRDGRELSNALAAGVVFPSGLIAFA